MPSEFARHPDNSDMIHRVGCPAIRRSSRPVEWEWAERHGTDSWLWIRDAGEYRYKLCKRCCDDLIRARRDG